MPKLKNTGFGWLIVPDKKLRLGPQSSIVIDDISKFQDLIDKGLLCVEVEEEKPDNSLKIDSGSKVVAFAEAPKNEVISESKNTEENGTRENDTKKNDTVLEIPLEKKRRGRKGSK